MMNSIILNAASRLLIALLLLFSVYMLFRGHNLPGGGFIGGLIGATGFIIYAIAHGVAATRSALRVEPQAIAGFGLGLALLSGVIPVLFGDPAFTGYWAYIGRTEESYGVPLSNIITFDIGVYLVVFGSILTIVLALEDEV